MHRGVAFVDQRALRVAVRREIDVKLRTRTARAGVAHHPEIVLLVAIDDMDLRDRDRRAKKFAPNNRALPDRIHSVRPDRAYKQSRKGAAVGNFQTFDTSSQAHSIASFLK